jgi:hypothetical protein
MKLMPLLIVLLPSFVGCLMIYQGFTQAAFVKATKTWSSTPGTVVSRRLDIRQRPERRGKLPVRMKSQKAAAVEYEYQLANRTIRGTQLISAGKRSVETILASYAPGDDVQVYFNPDEASNSFIERPTSNDGNLGILCGAALIAVAVWLAFRSQFA